MRRLIAAIMIAATAAFVMATSQGASASDPAAEADFVGKINALRASQGAGTLQVHSVLTAKAQAWAAHMAATGCLCHSNLADGVTVGWSKLGENVGRGPNVASLQAAFIASPEHFANMVDRSFQWVGIGVAYGQGQMWVAEVFMNGAPPPAPSGNPIGSLDNAVRGPGMIGVSGWTLDPNTVGSITVHVYVDGQPKEAITANRPRGDIARQFPGYGTAHGYSANVAVGRGDHTVCTYAINVFDGQGNPQLGCRLVTNTPFGSLDSATPSLWGTTVSGWAIGRDVTNPLAVHLYFNGHIVKAVTAGNTRTDVARAYPAYGTGHGFSVNVPNESGTLCAYAINGAGNGNNPLIGCKFVNTNPVGSLDGATRWGNGVRVRGWAIDVDTTAPVPVHIYVDGHPIAAITANNARADLGATFKAYSSSHAFDAVVPLGPGTHLVCAYAINRGSGFANPSLGCRVVA
jgi:Cysteine-rich secretory protein family